MALWLSHASCLKLGAQIERTDVSHRFNLVTLGKEEPAAPMLIDYGPEKSCGPCAHSLMVAKYETSLVQVGTQLIDNDI